MSITDDNQPIKKEVLLQTEEAWNGDAYISYPEGKAELTVLRITIQPHSVLDWHYHDMPNVGIVLSGDITIEEKDSGATRLITKGEVLAESVRTIHRGFTGKDGVVLIVFYAGASGVPLSRPAEGPAR